MKKKPIFIHSLFRTGSTYIWNKFRKNPHFYCLYEPFHQVLSETTMADLKTVLTRDHQLVNHPELDKYYLYEYRNLVNTHPEKGIQHFKKNFSFDLFCLRKKELNQKRYIDHLIKNAASKIPLFQFNRSAMRTGWFEVEYPDSLNIYIARYPRDQWQSYFELLKKTNDTIFYIMDIMIASKNTSHECFKMLSEYFPLIKYHDKDFKNEKEFYRIVEKSYSQQEKYFLFFYIWFKSYIENTINSDFLLNINRLSTDSEYQKELESFIFNHSGEKLKFNDVQIKEYSHYNLSTGIMEKIEKEAQNLALHSITEDQIDHFFQKISDFEKQYYQFDRNKFLKKKKSKLKNHNNKEKNTKKLKKMIFLFSDEHFKKLHELEVKLEKIEKLSKLLQESEADRKARLEQTEKLGKKFQESEADRKARLKQIQKLSKKLQESEADRKARLEQIQKLGKKFQESETNRKARLEQIERLGKLLQESEADRKARLEQIQKLGKQLQESEADRKARLEQIEKLGKQLQESEADRKARLEQIQKMSKRLQELEAFRVSKK